VGEVGDLSVAAAGLPRTHQLALAAADEALSDTRRMPEMIIVGVTTGGMLSTENYLKEGHRTPRSSPYHAAGSVAEAVAAHFRCSGPVLTVATACSSGAVAIKLALEILRRGAVTRVLAGGADSICRLTYYGFNSLQIVDRRGARPMDRDRQGMNVGEGAAMLLLTAADEPPPEAVAEILGGGLSCDAHHPAAPHPEGRGARDAMRDALDDAGLVPSDVDYINLHGTGTLENDLAEAIAVKQVFTGDLPPLSSVKGSFGHSLAAAGAIEAVVAALCIREGFLPANVGWQHQDPAIGFSPLDVPRRQAVQTVLSNSFGFGGNNAALALAAPGVGGAPAARPAAGNFKVRSYACLTGVGGTRLTLERFFEGRSCKGLLAAERLTEGLPPSAVRRLKRLARMAVGLAAATLDGAALARPVAEVYFGTAWGALSETHDFLEKLYATKEFFTSPIDFVGSVHNAPAGQVAMRHKARGANVTMTGGDSSFEQALMAAAYLAAARRDPVLVGGLDEFHSVFSALFDPSVPLDETPSDGGGMLLMAPDDAKGPTLRPGFFAPRGTLPETLRAAVAHHGGRKAFCERIGAVMVGLPAACRQDVAPHLASFWQELGFEGPVIDYRRYFGEFAAASAVAAVAAMALLGHGDVPAALAGSQTGPLAGRGILLLGLGETVTTLLAEPG
jgi:3-oxoacyl-[acyl-carrier-protein] synthase-1/3-oxoacyl-[acyl-carrier-protein] synthase II